MVASGHRVVPCGQEEERTDGHDEADSFFRKFANVPKTAFHSCVRQVTRTCVTQFDL